MKKDKKVYSRLLSWLLVFAMVLSMLPLNSVTVEATEVEETKRMVSSNAIQKENIKDLASDTYVAGSELTAGYYYLSESKEFINTASKGNGLAIASNATVYIYIPKDVTLTAKGANASGTVGAGAGIYVPSGATLILVGEGTVTATGGNASNGSNGSGGSSSSKTVSTKKFHAGSGGAGGNGGGGAGAGIGTPGGNGGSGLGSGGSSYSISKDDGANGYAGTNGQNGVSTPAMGNVYAVNTMTITATGGQAGTASRTGGSSGSASSSMDDADGWDLDRKIAGGAGGGAGGGGFSAYGIGTGGGGGGQGGGGGSAGYLWTYATIGGGGGGAGAGAGNAGGGTCSSTGKFSGDRDGSVSAYSASGTSTSNTTSGGAGGQGGAGTVKPNKGSATSATGGTGGQGGNAGAKSIAYNNNIAKAYEETPYTIHFNVNGTDKSTQSYAYGESVSVTMPVYNETDVFIGWEVTTAGISSINTENTAFTVADTTLYRPGDVVTLDPGFTGDVTITAKMVDISAYGKVNSQKLSINTDEKFKEDVYNQEYTFSTKLNDVYADMGTMELRNEYTGMDNGKEVSADKNGKYTYTADSRGNTSYNIYYNNVLAPGNSWIHTLENVNKSPVIDFYSTSVKIKVQGATSVKNVSLKAQKNAKAYTLNWKNTDADFLEYYIETVKNADDKYDLYVNDICLVEGIKLDREHDYVVYLLGTTVTLLKDNEPYSEAGIVPEIGRNVTTADKFKGVALIPFSDRSDVKKPNGMQEGWENSTYIYEEAYLGENKPNDLKGVLKIGNDFWTADAPNEEDDGIRGGYYTPGADSSLEGAKISLDGQYYIVDYYTVSYEGDKDAADSNLQYETGFPESQVYMKKYEISLPNKVEPTDQNYFFYRWLQHWVDVNDNGTQDIEEPGWNPADATNKAEFAYLAGNQVDDETASGTNKYEVIGKTKFVADCLAKDIKIAVADDYTIDENKDNEGHYVIDLGYVYESYPNENWVLPNGLGNEDTALFGNDWIQNNGTVNAEVEYITHTNTVNFEEPVYQCVDANTVQNIISPFNYADNGTKQYVTLNIAPKADLAVGEYTDTITVASKVPGADSYLKANELTFKVAFEVKADTFAPSITIGLPDGAVSEKIGDTDKYVYYYDKTDVPTIEISANDDDATNDGTAEDGCVHDGTDVDYIKYYLHQLNSDEEAPKTIDELKTFDENKWISYDATSQPKLDDGTYYVYVKAADNASTPNVSYAISEKIIVDKKPPVIGIDNTEYCIGQEFTFTVLDKYFDKVEYISDEELEEGEASPVTITTEKAEATNTYTVTVNTNSKAVGTIKLSVKDKAGNTNAIEVTIHGNHVKKLEKVHEVSRFFHGRTEYKCTVCGHVWEDFAVRINPTGITNIKPYNFFEYYTAYEDGRRYLENENLIEKYDFNQNGYDDDLKAIQGNIEYVRADAEYNANMILEVQMFLQAIREDANELLASEYVPNEEQDVLLEELLENYSESGIGLRKLLENYSDYVYPTRADFEADNRLEDFTTEDIENFFGNDVSMEDLQAFFTNLVPLDEAKELLADLEEREATIAEIKAELQKFDDAIANSKIPTLETVKATDRELLETLQTAGEKLLHDYDTALTDAKKAELTGILTDGYSKEDENGNSITMPSIQALLERIVAVEKLIVEIETENATLPVLEDVNSGDSDAIIAVGMKVGNFLENLVDGEPQYKQNITDGQRERLVNVLGVDPEEDSEINPEELDGVFGKLIRIQMIAEEMENIFDSATGEKDFTNSEIVTIDDVPYMEELIARIDVLLATNNLTTDERKDLEELKDSLNAGLTVVDNLTKDLQEIEESIANLPADDVITSDSLSVIAELMQKIRNIAGNYSGDEEGIMNFTEEQKDRIIALHNEILPAKQAKILEVQEALDSVYAYAEPILEVENITSDYADELKVLLGTETEIGMIDAMLAIDNTANDFGDNLTATEREALETLRAKLQAKQYLLKPVEERIQELIDKLEDLPEVDLVKSSDEAFVNEVKGLVEELLKNYSNNLTDDEIAELNALNDEIGLRSERIKAVRDAYKALETEVNKIPDVEKVTKENLENLEQLIEDIVHFVEQYYEDEDVKDNFTDSEKANITEWMETLSEKSDRIAEVQEEFNAIKEAVEAIPNNETVKATDKDVITTLKERANALFTNNSGNLTTDETVELNKIVGTLDEKIILIDTVANAIKDITDNANALPENVTSDNKATIDEYVKAVETIESNYANNMTDEQKTALGAVKTDLTTQQELLEALGNRLAKLEKDVDAVPAIDKVTMDDKENIENLLNEIANINNVSANHLTATEKTALADMEAELRNKLGQITDLDAKVKELANKVALMEEKDVTSDDTNAIAQLADEIQNVMTNHSGNLTPVQQSDLMGMKVTLSMKQAEIDEVVKAIKTIENANAKIPSVDTVTSDDAKAIDKLIDRIEDTLLDYDKNLTEAEKTELANMKGSLEQNQKTKIAEVAGKIEEIEDLADAIPDADEITNADAKAIDALEGMIDETLNTYAKNLTKAEKEALEALKQELVKKEVVIKETNDLLAEIREKANAISPVETVTSVEEIAISELTALVEAILDEHSDKLTKDEKAELKAIAKDLEQKQGRIDDVEEVVAEIEEDFANIPETSEVTSDDASAIEKLIAKMDETVENYKDNLTTGENSQTATLETIKSDLMAKQAKIAEVATAISKIEADAEAIPSIDELTSKDSIAIKEVEKAIDDVLENYATHLTAKEEKALKDLKKELAEKETAIKATEDLLAEIKLAARELPQPSKVTSANESAIADLMETVENTLDTHNKKLTDAQKKELTEIRNGLTNKMDVIETVANKIETIEADATTIPSVAQVTGNDEDAILALEKAIDDTLATYANGETVNLTDVETKKLNDIKADLAVKKAMIERVASEVEELEALAKEIPSIDKVTSADVTAIDNLEAEINKALADYADNLTDAQKSALEKLQSELTEKEVAIKETTDLLAEIRTEAEAIPAINTVTSEAEAKIDALLEKIALTSETHKDALTDVEKEELANIKKAVEEKKAVVVKVVNTIATIEKTADELIPVIENVTSENETTINELVAEIDTMLTDYANNLTTGENSQTVKLETIKENLLAKKAKIEEVAEEIEEIEEKVSEIPSIDKVTSDDKEVIDSLIEAIDDVLANYANNLTEEETTELNTMKSELSKKNVAVQETADLLAEIRTEAEAIPTVEKVTSANKTAIDNLLEKIDNTRDIHDEKLTRAEKSELKKLENALESKKEKLEEIADVLDAIREDAEKIPSINKVTSADKKDIDKLVEMIEEALADYANNLTTAEATELENIKSDLSDKKEMIKEVATAVEEMKALAKAIPSVDKVTSEDAKAIEALQAKVEKVLADYANNLTKAEKEMLEALAKELTAKEVVIKGTKDLLAEIRTEAEAIPSVDKVTSAEQETIDTLLEKIDDISKLHKDTLTKSEKEELAKIKDELEAKKDRISQIAKEIDKIEKDASKVPEKEDLSSKQQKSIESLIKVIDELMNNYSENLTEEETKELVKVREELVEKAVYISRLPQYKPSEGDLNNTTDSSKNTGNAMLDESDKELVNKIPLTSAEKEAVALGDKVDVYLEVKDISATVSATDKALVTEKLENVNDKLAMYIDVNLYKKVGANEAQKITETNGLVTIMFKVPENLLNNDSTIKRVYKIVRVHEGVAEIIDAEFNAQAKTISFETDRFSTYALIYNDTTVVDKSPSTGIADITMYLLVMLAGVGIYCYSKKNKYFA